MALKKWNVVRPENIKKETMFNTPPQPVSGGHHIVLLYTVARETHLMMPIATTGPQWHKREKMPWHILSASI